MSKAAKVSIILDTDMDTDCDDAGALGILNTYMNQGKVNMLAVICDAPTEWGGACIENINRYYFNPDIPIGVVKTSDFSSNELKRFNAYYKHVAGLWIQWPLNM